jgi:hypothetical protein
MRRRFFKRCMVDQVVMVEKGRPNVQMTLSAGGEGASDPRMIVVRVVAESEAH